MSVAGHGTKSLVALKKYEHNVFFICSTQNVFGSTQNSHQLLTFDLVNVRSGKLNHQYESRVIDQDAPGN